MDNTQSTVTPTPPVENTPPLGSTPVASSVPPVSPAPHKRRNLLPFIAFIAIFIGFGLLALWYYQTAMKKSNEVSVKPVPVEVTTSKPFVVGIDPTYPPMEYVDGNTLMGYDIDLANLIGKELGVQIKFKNILFDDLFSALENDSIDMIISTVTVTDERKQKYDFSEPYLQAGQVILAQKTNTTITDTTNLAGKRIGVQKGTTIETEALKYTSDKFVVRYPDFVEATAALVKGDIDVVFADLPGAKGIVNENPTLKIASDPFTTEYYAVVFKKGSTKIAKINEALSSLKAKGILTELNQKWLD